MGTEGKQRESERVGEGVEGGGREREVGGGASLARPAPMCHDVPRVGGRSEYYNFSHNPKP